MKCYVQGFTQGLEEMEDELQSSIGGDMRWNSMLGEHMEDKEMSKLSRGDGVVSQNENQLLGKPINNNQCWP